MYLPLLKKIQALLALMLIGIAIASYGYSNYIRSQSEEIDSVQIAPAETSQTAMSILPIREKVSSLDSAHRYIKIKFSDEALNLDKLNVYIPHHRPRLEIVNSSEGIEIKSISSSSKPLTNNLAVLSISDPLALEKGELILKQTMVGGINKVQPFELSKIYYSDVVDYSRISDIRGFFEGTIKPLALGFQIFLAVYALTLGLIVRVTTIVWIGVFFLTTSIITIGTLIPHNIMPQDTFRFIFITLSGLPGIVLLGLWAEIGKRNIARLIRPIAIVSCVVNGFLITIFPHEGEKIYIFLNAPFILAGYALLLLEIIKSTGFGSRASKVIFVGCYIVLFLGWAHDLLLHTQILNYGFYLGQFTRLAFVLICASYLLDYQYRIYQQANIKSEHQRRIIEEQALTIRKNLTAELEWRQAKAVEHERNRMKRELHDGISGNLISILSVANQATNRDLRIERLARQAISELKTVVETSSLDTGRLGHFISIFRENYAPLYDINDADVAYRLSPEALDLTIKAELGMDIIRVLQECYTNIVKHAPGARVEVLITTDAKEVVELRIQNTFSLKGLKVDSTGSGLQNIAHRIEKWGGFVTHKVQGSEFSLVIALPTK